mgnify:CR=1 FL=1
MNKVDTLKKLKQVFESLLGKNDFEISSEVATQGVKGLYYLCLFQVVVLVNKILGLKFCNAVMNKLRNPGDIINVVEAKI